MVSISHGDGVRIDVPGAPTVVVDAARPTDGIPVYTHAHGDHLYDSAPETAICSPLTRELAAVRRESVPDRREHPDVSLIPSGHIPGSRAVLIEGDQRVLHTGDCALADRALLAGFEPPAADVLVVESTYGEPAYEFPAPATVEREIVTWLTETRGRPVVLFGYALGRAQAFQALIARSERDRVFVSESIRALNEPIEAALEQPFGARSLDAIEQLGPDDAIVVPGRLRGHEFVEELLVTTDALTASASGWAVDAYRFADAYDETFVYSDHCDFPALLAVVDRVDPDRVYTIHGASETLATELTARGYEATALKPDQHTLGEY